MYVVVVVVIVVVVVVICCCSIFPFLYVRGDYSDITETFYVLTFSYTLLNY